MMKFNDLFADLVIAIYHNHLVSVVCLYNSNRFGHLRNNSGLLPDEIRESEEYSSLVNLYEKRKKLASEFNRKIGKDKRYREFRKKFDMGDHLRLVRIEKKLVSRHVNGEEKLMDFENFVVELSYLMNDESFK